MAKLQIYLDQDNPFTRDLTEEKITVGRLADNSIHLDEVSVSSHHAELISEGGQYHLHDLGSTNGTFVNGEAVTDAILRNGDEVRFGKVEVVFSSDENGVADQPLPESSQVEVMPGAATSRPTNFVSSSPFGAGVKKRNPIGVAVLSLALVSFLAFVAVIINIFMMKPPA
ncbi:MAG: FHA domain-containing protein [Chthoniobacterales bacterium]